MTVFTFYLALEYLYPVPQDSFAFSPSLLRLYECPRLFIYAKYDAATDVLRR